MKQTPNYNLPQFTDTDLFNKEDYNDAFNKIDKAISDLQETFNNSASDGSLVAQEVLIARNGKKNLKERIDEIDEKSKKANSDIQSITKLITDFGAKGNGITDDTLAFKKALRVAYDSGSVRLRVPKGDYLIDGYADIYSNTYIEFDKGAKIIKSNTSTTSYLFVCGRVEDEGTTGYGGGAKNITIIGGEFIGFPENNIGISITLNHAQNCEFKNITFINCVSNGHAFDLCGCDNITIDNCIFKGRTIVANREFTEAIQIDNSTQGSLSNNFSNYDDLPSKNIYVRRCSFVPVYNSNGEIVFYAPNPIGSHSFVPNRYFENICFSDNYVENAYKQEGDNSGGWIRFYSVKGCYIERNKFINTKSINAYCIAIQTKAINEVSNISSDVFIMNNHVEGFDTKQETGVYSAIRVYGNSVSTVKNIYIENNIFKECYNKDNDITLSRGCDLINISYSSGISIKNNNVDVARRLCYIIYGDSIFVTNNNIKKCYYVPVNMSDCCLVDIIDNIFNDTSSPIYTRNIKDLKICGNIITNTLNNVVGTFKSIIASNANKNVVIGNNIITNTNEKDGFIVINIYGGSKNNVVHNNIITGYTNNVVDTQEQTVFIDNITKNKFV